MTSARRWNFATFSIILLLACLFQTSGAIRHGWISDDAFISYRYVRHLLDGHGLVWNVGERPPVEGYTNFLYILVLTLGGSLGAPILGWSVLFNLLCSYATMAITVWIMAGLVGRLSWVCAVPAFLLGIHQSFNYWVCGGLESHLFALLLTLVTALLVSGHGRLGPSRLAVLSGLFACLSLTRPEGIGVFGGVVVVYLYKLRGDHARPAKERLWRALCLALPFVMLIGGHLAWRWHYYFDLFPNTYHAKTGGGPAQIVRGIRYLREYIYSNDGILLPLVTLAAFPFWGPKERIVGAMVGWMTAMIVAVGGDGLLNYRFIVHVLPLAYVCVGIAAAAYLKAFGERPAPIRGLVTIILVLVIGACFHRQVVVDGYRFSRSWILRVPAYLAGGEWPPSIETEDDPLRDAGVYLRERLPKGTLIAANPVGRIGFYSELPVLDMLGLCDRTIARTWVPGMGLGQAGHERYNGVYVLRRRPAVILPGSDMVHPRRYELDDTRDIQETWGAHMGLTAADFDLYAREAFHERYRSRIVELDDHKYLHLLIRSDLIDSIPSAIMRPTP